MQMRKKVKCLSVSQVEVGYNRMVRDYSSEKRLHLLLKSPYLF